MIKLFRGLPLFWLANLFLFLCCKGFGKVMINHYGQRHTEVHQQQTILNVPTVMALKNLNFRFPLATILYISIATYR